MHQNRSYFRMLIRILFAGGYPVRNRRSGIFRLTRDPFCYGGKPSRLWLAGRAVPCRVRGARFQS